MNDAKFIVRIPDWKFALTVSVMLAEMCAGTGAPTGGESALGQCPGVCVLGMDICTCHSSVGQPPT
jgi:hypothetical protein